jgi:hypothetical protein
VTFPVDPAPGIHNIPPLDSNAFTVQDAQQYQIWGQQLLFLIAKAIVEALLNVSVLGTSPWDALKAFGLDPGGIIDTIVSALGGSGSALSDLTTALEDIPQGNVSGLVTALGDLLSSADFQNLLDAIANALGFTGTGHTITNVQTYLGEIPNVNITNILGTSNLGTDVQAIVDKLSNAFGQAGTGHTLANLLSYAEAIPSANVVNILGTSNLGTDVQAIVDELANAWGHAGTGHTLANLLSYAGSIPGSVLSGATTVEQSIIDNIHQAVQGGSSTGNAVSDVKTQLQDVFTNLFGTSTLGTILATAAIPNITRSMSSDLQSVIDNIHQAVQGGSSTGNTAADVKTQLQDIFTNLFGSSTLGTVLTTAAIPNITKAMSTDLQAAIDAVYQAINGGSSTGNTVASVKTSLLAIPSANVNNILGTTNLGTDVQAIVDKLANAWGQAGTGHTLANLLSYAGAIPNTVITNVLGSASLGADVQAIVDKISNALGQAGTGHTLANLLSYLGAIPNANITNILGNASLGADLQAVVDKFVNLLTAGSSSGNSISTLSSDFTSAFNGYLPTLTDNGDGTTSGISGTMTSNSDGTVTTTPSSPLYALIDNGNGTLSNAADALGAVYGSRGTEAFSTGNWQTLLANTNTQNASNLVSSLSSLIPAVIANGDGTLKAIGQVVENGDGTFTYTGQQVPVLGAVVNSLVDNSDGTLMSFAETVDNAVQNANLIGSNLNQGSVGIFGHLYGALNGFGTAPSISPAQSYTSLLGVASTLQNNVTQLGGIGGLNVSSANDALQRSAVSVTGGSSGVRTTVNFTSDANASTVTGFTIGAIPNLSSNYERDMGIQSAQVAWGYGLDGNTVSSASPSQTVTYWGNINYVYQYITQYWYTTAEGAYYLSTPTNTDYQIVSMVMNTANDINGGTTHGGYTANGTNQIYARVNSAATSFVWASLGNGTAALGCVVSSSSTTFITVNHTAIMGATYELRVGNPSGSDVWFIGLYCNGALVTSYEDSGHVSQNGSSYRYAGFAMMSQYVAAYRTDGTLGWSGYYYPATVTYWKYLDNATPAVVGSFFRAYKTSASTNAITSGTVFSTSATFDTLERCSSDLTYSSGAGTVTVSIPGTYLVTCRIITSNSSACTAYVVRNGTEHSLGMVGGSFTNVSAVSSLVYCAANDTLALAPNASTNVAAGDAGGDNQWWSVAMVNCGTLS